MRCSSFECPIGRRSIVRHLCGGIPGRPIAGKFRRDQFIAHQSCLLEATGFIILDRLMPIYLRKRSDTAIAGPDMKKNFHECGQAMPRADINPGDHDEWLCFEGHITM